MTEPAPATPPPDEAFRPRLTAKLLSRPGYDFQILIAQDRPVWAAVTGSAEDFVALADGTRTIAQIADGVAGRYDAARDQVLSDALGFFRALHGAGFFAPLPDSGVPPVTSLFLHLTDRCNLSCRHCYLAAGPERGRFLPLDLVKRYLDDLVAGGGNQVVLSGGEPLLHEGFEEIVRHIGDRLRIRLLTNGLAVTDRIAELFAGRNCALQVSLDGPTAEVHDAIRGPGTFDRALAAIRIFQRHGLNDRLNVSCVVQEGNIHLLEKMARLTHSLGVPLLRILPMMWEGNARTSYPEESRVPDLQAHINWYDRVLDGLADQFPGLSISPGLAGLTLDLSSSTDPLAWCPLGRTIILDAEGEIFPCALCRRPEHRLGNAREIDLPALVASPGRVAIMRQMRGRRDRLEPCRECPYRQLCQAGCPGIALIHHGTTEAVDGFCEYRKQKYEHFLFEVVRERDRLASLPAFQGA